MNKQQQNWLLRAAILITVFLIVLSMDLPKMFGWNQLLLCFVFASAIIWGWTNFAKRPVLSFWLQASKKKRLLIVASFFLVYTALNLLLNYGKPDASSKNWSAIFAGIAGLILCWGYGAFSRALYRLSDRVHSARAKR